MSELADKLTGKAKQAVGKITDDKQLQAEGKAQELKGKAEGALNDTKTKVENKVEEMKKDHNDK